MRSRFLLIALLAISTMPLAAQQTSKATAAASLPQLEQMTARFAPTSIRVDTSKLSDGDRQALVKLIEAGRLIDTVFMQQYWSGNLALYARLKQDTTPLGKARLHYFWLNKGPWSEIDEHKAFLSGVPARKPAGANFYPEDMTKEEFETWVKTLPAADKQRPEGFFTAIRRGPDRKLRLVPYSQEYQSDLDQLARLLREASDLTPNASLKRFLN